MVRRSVGVGLIGLGNVGRGALEILTENGKALEEKLGFPLSVKGVCSRSIQSKKLPPFAEGIARFENWRDLIAHPEVDVVAELIGGTATAKGIIESVSTHN